MKKADFEVCSVSLEGKVASPQPAKGSWRSGCSTTCTGKGDGSDEWFWRGGRRVEERGFARNDFRKSLQRSREGVTSLRRRWKGSTHL